MSTEHINDLRARIEGLQEELGTLEAERARFEHEAYMTSLTPNERDRLEGRMRSFVRWVEMRESRKPNWWSLRGDA